MSNEIFDTDVQREVDSIFTEVTDDYNDERKYYMSLDCWCWQDASDTWSKCLAYRHGVSDSREFIDYIIRHTYDELIKSRDAVDEYWDYIDFKDSPVSFARFLRNTYHLSREMYMSFDHELTTLSVTVYEGIYNEGSEQMLDDACETVYSDSVDFEFTDIYETKDLLTEDCRSKIAGMLRNAMDKTISKGNE